MGLGAAARREGGKVAEGGKDMHAGAEIELVVASAFAGDAGAVGALMREAEAEMAGGRMREERHEVEEAVERRRGSPGHGVERKRVRGQ